MKAQCPKCKHEFEFSLRKYSEDNKKAVIKSLRKPKTWTELKKEVPVSQPTLNRILKNLIKSGKVEQKYFAKEGRVKYMLKKGKRVTKKKKEGKK